MLFLFRWWIFYLPFGNDGLIGVEESCKMKIEGVSQYGSGFRGFRLHIGFNALPIPIVRGVNIFFKSWTYMKYGRAILNGIFLLSDAICLIFKIRHLEVLLITCIMLYVRLLYWNLQPFLEKCKMAVIWLQNIFYFTRFRKEKRWVFPIGERRW